MHLIVDAHEDLAWNMMTFERDYTLSAIETRQRELGTTAPEQNGDTLLGWPEYQDGGVAVIFATLFAAPLRRKEGDWDKLCYVDGDQAYELYRSQMDLYHRLVEEHPDKFRLIHVQDDLRSILDKWRQNDLQIEYPPVGLIALMEGAEGLRGPAELEEWWLKGVRLIGPAWAGNRYCGGTGEPGGLTHEGYTLLETMSSLGFGLDTSHMDEPATLQALDVYTGTIVATHSNALALLKGSDSNRHLTDRVIRGIIERGGVIGVVFANDFLQAGWKRGDGREQITLQHVAAQIDYMCQIAGDAQHVGLGTDFDGGFGLQSVPLGLDTIADLSKLVPLLYEKGYSQADVLSIMGENWLRILKQILPDSL
jgi:membrane dipeptidase